MGGKQDAAFPNHKCCLTDHTVDERARSKKSNKNICFGDYFYFWFYFTGEKVAYSSIKFASVYDIITKIVLLKTPLRIPSLAMQLLQPYSVKRCFFKQRCDANHSAPSTISEYFVNIFIFFTNAK